MKKDLILLAGLAVAAMSACTQSEVILPASGESLVSFLPLATTATKASPITKYETTTGDFKVFAWYQKSDVNEGHFSPENNTATLQPKNYTLYMNGVVCKYSEGDKNAADTGEGAWMPTDNDGNFVNYYWPKNGKLTFSAYYPASENLSVDAFKGITVKDYTVKDATKQVDLMFSNRAFDKTSSNYFDNENGNKLYDGVDIVFNHALSAADFKVKLAKDYGEKSIKVQKIEIVKAYSKGDFAEGYTTGKESDSPVAEWTNQSDVKDSYGVFSGSVAPTTEASQVGETCILLPQNFSDDVKVVVTYSIYFKDGSADKWLQQTAEFPLKGTKNSADDSEIKGWEMGKWYHYTFTFTLDQVYFAPSVSDWKDVVVKDFEVK